MHSAVLRHADSCCVCSGKSRQQPRGRQLSRRARHSCRTGPGGWTTHVLLWSTTAHKPCSSGDPFSTGMRQLSGAGHSKVPMRTLHRTGQEMSGTCEQGLCECSGKAGQMLGTRPKDATSCLPSGHAHALQTQYTRTQSGSCRARVEGQAGEATQMLGTRLKEVERAARSLIMHTLYRCSVQGLSQTFAGLALRRRQGGPRRCWARG